MLHLDGFVTEFRDEKDIGYENIVWINLAQNKVVQFG